LLNKILAPLIRLSIKRLNINYIKTPCLGSVGTADIVKNHQLKDEIKGDSQIQLINIPIDENTDMTENAE
jgi:hypothetical protein